MDRTPEELDDDAKNGKICDRIITEIRRASLVIADVTMQSPGVYFEAGFARALGADVIWCCKKDEEKKVHFDTRQYFHIFWKDPADLRKQLSKRISAWHALPKA